ncbi:MAG: NAD-dependent epimerase/dehydratase family protein [Erysipelotrichaceae bacterium]|nr:NAD-dependent epimerase/dehydratase family protein [Erysipelotrichaceae bacterium]
MKILVMGGTVFVSRSIAEYYVAKGHDVYVLNRNTKMQSEGVKLIEADRHHIGDLLRQHDFDVVVDNAYTSADVEQLLDALGNYRDYILISSSAVYPEHEIQPFKEDSSVALNKYWGKYGTDKIEAENILLKRNPNAYVIRPPYIYGPLNNVYREAFVFDCALQNREFYIPKNGEMMLQFFHIDDLCRFIDVLIEKKPDQHVFNVGNKELISVRDWAELCYRVAGKEFSYRNVYENIDQRKYFSFYDYEYCLDVAAQCELMGDLKLLKTGLKESLQWYLNHPNQVVKKSYIEFIDQNLLSK